MPLTNAQYDELMRSYQQKQLARHRLISEREEEIMALSPRMAEFNAEIADLSVAEARRRLGAETAEGDSSAETDLSARANTSGVSSEAGPAARDEAGRGQAARDEAGRGVWDRIAALDEEKRRLIVSMGYPEDYLDPPYDCPDCRDTGYIGSNRCHCFRQAAIDLVYSQSGRPRIFERECFENFSLEYYPKDLIDRGTGISAYEAADQAFDRCRRFVEEFDDSFQNLFLFGDVGVGKTFLCNCIAGELIRTGHSVIYFTADRLFRLLADHAFGRDNASEEDYSRIFDCDLLIIDDLGTELPNALTVSQFFICLNDRILDERSTVISSNLDLHNIKDVYTERISSRISSCYTLLHLFGDDIRLKKTAG